VRSADALIILQARVRSTRLPGKALRPLAGRTLLARAIERLVAAGAAPLVLATTEREDDDLLVETATALGVTCMRGPDEDVLARFAQVVVLLGPTYVVRATADNPAVDMDAPRRVLEHLQRGNVDYVLEQGLPTGAAVEGIRASALLEAAARATDPYDREHVTPFLRAPEHRFRTLAPQAPPAVRRPDLRFTVDTAEDFVWMTAVFTQAGAAAGTVPLTGIIRAADRLIGVREVA
jgi:spore coat polysaccharide biosynthesis protein SpsF